MDFCSLDNRADKRIVPSCLCIMHKTDLEHDQTDDSGCLLNISVGGACVEAQAEYPLYSYVRLYVSFSGVRPFSVYGRIIRVTESTNLGLLLYQYGIQFIGLSHAESEYLSHKLNQMHLVLRKNKLSAP